MDEGGSRNGAALPEEAQFGEPLGRAPLLGTLEDMLRLWIWASLSSGGPLCLRETWNPEWGHVYR